MVINNPVWCTGCSRYSVKSTFCIQFFYTISRTRNGANWSLYTSCLIFLLLLLLCFFTLSFNLFSLRLFLGYDKTKQNEKNWWNLFLHFIIFVCFMKILYITLFCVNLHTFFSVAPQLNENKLRDQKSPWFLTAMTVTVAVAATEMIQ